MDTYDSDGVITSKTETVVYTIEDMDNGVYALKNTIIDDYVFYGWTTEKQFEPENTITSVNELNDYIFYSYYEYGTKGVVYEKAGETYAVTGYQGNDSDFIIAVLHNGLPVTTINPSALKDNLTVESITISKYISNIGLFAFNGCKNVTQVYYAADNCQDLAEDTRAFYYLGQNKSGVTVTVADNVQRIPEHLFFAWILDTTKTYHPKLKTIQFEDNAVCQEISKRAFGWCFEITSIEIPESVKTIGKEAFSKLYYVENIYFNAIGCGDVAVTDKVFEDLAKHNDGVVITVGKNVTTIPSGMFNGLGGTTTNIKDIYFATNGALTSIGSGAFAGAKKLTKVEIPETIQNVELSAFMYCSSLTEFAVPKSVKVLYLSGCTSLQEITFNSVIEELYVDSCSSLINVTLPNTLKKVDFSHCTSIETLELPDGVTSAMFTGCSKLGTMTLPAGFTEVADNMFKDCSFLKGVEFEGEVTRIGDYAFSNCAMLGGSLPSSVKYIGAHAYEYTAKTMFSASYNLETIGEYAFRGCSKLYYVSIDIKTISKYAFYNCTTLDTLYIDFGVENIEEYAFYNTGITSIELPISVKKLGSNAFNYENFDLILENKVNPSEFLYSTYYSSDTTYGNNNITSNNYSYVIYNGEAYITKYSGSENSVTIPTEIDGYPVVALVGTYCGNSYINEVYIPESITWIDYDAFYNCNNITAFYLYADNKPDNWHDSWNHNKTPYWDYQGAVSENGFDFLIIGEEAYIVGYNGAETDLSVPNKFNDKTVKGFMGDVFNGNTTIRTIFIPETFVELPDKLFYNCTSLTGIALDNIITIGKEAFYGCTSLKEIILSSALINIGDNAFYNCSIETVTAPTIALPFFNNGNLKTVVINGGKEIPESAFYNCESLTSVVIPNSVTSIG
ncbi:MAG: leucine-rich repeat protein, partial [Clostridia bacterium]|nr:leucine-rich repeat protein [Clostridia bacterium]